MRRFRKVRHVPLPLLAVMMAAILFAELARCEREGAKETAAEAEKSVPRRAALTFDDGPNACYTPEVLEILKENEIPATFFLQGQCLAGNEEIVRRMHAEGHLIGNHTFHHVQLTKVSEEEAREEVVKTSNAIYEITGEYPVYIRPPFGEWREGLDLAVTMIPVLWDVDSRDWESQNTASICSAVLPNVKDGSIILMHDGYRATVEALRRIVKELKEEGYTFVTARVIANTTSAEFTQLNATTAGKKDMEEVVKEAQQRIGMYGKKTILFVDEIHRFNKGQQDYLLPFVEDGTLVLIGATTENPYFEVNGALISRSIIFELKPLEKEDIEKLLERAVTDPVKGLGTYNVVLDADAKEFLADIAGGDARAALNAIELGVLSTERQADGKIHIDLETASECIQKRVVRYDKTGDQHYDTISAFIKSMRGSDPDAAVFYLAKMLYAGEDIKFIARRIMICAAEDVGLADPNALNVAVSASLAVERVGMPEAQIILAEAATYVACAPKSNSSCEAVFAAMKTVGSVRTSVPPHLQDAHYKGSAKLGHGQGYQYAHDYPNHYVEQQYLPDEILGSRFLHLGTNGYEQKIRENFKKIGKDIE